MGVAATTAPVDHVTVLAGAATREERIRLPLKDGAPAQKGKRLNRQIRKLATWLDT